MKLLKLSARNFRGINVEFAPNGRDVKICGCNGAGKTTTEDAFLWLLFGKDSADRKGYDLIPHKPGSTDPDVGRGLEPTVEAKLEYSDKTITLKKSYIEDWPKRGALKGQYAGSKTHYFVDGLEVKAGEYNSAVDELINPDLFKLLTNPHYFTDELSWQERRATLVKIAGDLHVEMDPELTKLMNHPEPDGTVSHRAFDSLYALAKQNVKATQKELEGMPYAITEAKRLIPTETPEMPDVAALKKQQEDLENQIQTLKNDDSANAVRREIAELETKIAEGRRKYAEKIDAENAKIKDGINSLEDKISEKTRELNYADSQKKQLKSDLADLSDQKAAKLAEWHKAKDRQWTGSEICPTCGQKFPKEQIEPAKAAFNRQRSNDLEKLKSEGLGLKKQIEGKSREAESLKEKAETAGKDIKRYQENLEKGKSLLKPCVYETQIEYKDLNGRLTDLKDQLEKGTDAEKNSKLDMLAGELDNVKQQIEDASRVKLQIEQAEKQKKHVAELEAQQRQAAADLGHWEKAVALCEEHVKKSARVLEKTVNGKFKIARFRMFAPQKNGEEAECCDIVYPNGSTNLSTGERLQTGIDIINTLSKYYGVDAPIWIDNAEGITLPVETDSQVIRLIVSPTNEKLRIEVQE